MKNALSCICAHKSLNKHKNGLSTYSEYDMLTLLYNQPHTHSLTPSHRTEHAFNLQSSFRLVTNWLLGIHIVVSTKKEKTTTNMYDDITKKFACEEGNRSYADILICLCVNKNIIYGKMYNKYDSEYIILLLNILNIHIYWVSKKMLLLFFKRSFMLF